jgi:hypothetical protein
MTRKRLRTIGAGAMHSFIDAESADRLYLRLEPSEQKVRGIGGNDSW